MQLCTNLEDCSKKPAQPSPVAQTPPTLRQTKNSLRAANDTATPESLQKNSEITSVEITIKREDSQQSDVNNSMIILDQNLSTRLTEPIPQQPNKENSPALTTTTTVTSQM